MKFSGCDLNVFSDSLLAEAEAAITDIFFDLGIRYDNAQVDYNSRSKKTNLKMGGDPFIYQMVVNYKHIASGRISTAATDGEKYFWNPHFVLALSPLALRFVIFHEATHAIYNHSERRGPRDPRLWNLAVDYITNFYIVEDLVFRSEKNDGSGNNTKAVFTAPTLMVELGNFVTLKDFEEMYKNPDLLEKMLQRSVDMREAKNKRVGEYETAFQEKRVLTPEEDKAFIEKIRQDHIWEPNAKDKPGFFIDPNLPEDLRTPEQIYDYLISKLPKCSTCGKVGVSHKKNKKNEVKVPGSSPKQKGKNQDKGEGENPGEDSPGDNEGDGEGDGQSSKHSHSHNGKPCDHDHSSDSKQKGKGKGKSQESCDSDPEMSDETSSGKGDSGEGEGEGEGESGDGEGNGEGEGDGEDCESDGNGGCGDCKDSADLLGLGNLLDEHLDSEVDQQEMAARLADAIKQSKMSAGHVPGGMEGELGELVKPVLTFKDAIRLVEKRSRDGGKKADYTRYKKRALMSGNFIPKRKEFIFKAGILVDCSGSMSDQDIVNGISQLQNMQELNSATMIPADADIYWDQSVQLTSVKADELKKFKVVGRGGTMFDQFFVDYEQHIGEQDMLIIITDGYLYNEQMTDPGIPVIWIVTNNHSRFEPPFGKSFELNI